MRALILLAGVAVVVGLLPSSSPGALDVAKGTFRGTYFADRWGQHHFAGRFVDPKLKDQFEPFAGQPAIADVKKNYQPMNPGGAVILEVGKIEAATKDLPVSLELAWKNPPRGATAAYQRAEPNDAITLTAKLTNRTDHALTIASGSGNEVWLHLMSQMEVPGGVTGIGHTRGLCMEHEYTKRVWVHRGAYRRLLVEDQSVDFGDPTKQQLLAGVEIAAGKSVSWELKLTAPPANEYELWLAYQFTIPGPEPTGVILSKPARLDVLALRPVPDDGPVSVGLKLGAVPPKPTRPIPAEVTFTNTGKETVEFRLPL